MGGTHARPRLGPRLGQSGVIGGGTADHIGKCFQAWDPEVLQGLPCEVRRGLMGIPTQKGGLTFSFIEHAMAMVAQGSSISSVLSARNEVARRDYHVKEVEYLSYIAQHWASGIGPGSDGVSGQSSGGTQKTLTDLWAAVVQQEDAVGGEGTERRGGRRRARENELAPSVRQRSLTFKILRIDAGYKNAKKVRCADGSRAMEGTVAILNEINQVVAIFHGSGGLKELEEPLRRLKQRNEELGGGPVELIYVDNCRTVAGFLERLFVGAKVKEDLFHVLQRMRDTLPHGHPLADPFMKEYTAACKVRDPSDEKKAREVYGVEPSDSNCRSYIPRPEVLEPRVQAVFDKYKKGGGGLPQPLPLASAGLQHVARACGAHHVALPGTVEP
ncbi:hypothetical protein PLESTM_000688000 [Pleodorina starrii]|nr:hypothetical protein PLESTM_000688000 [Pleodorina starrii]